jgi:high affinity Mn2+ porin
MKALLIATLLLTALSGGVCADDLPILTPLKAPPPSAPSAYGWSGLYAGGHLGLAWGNSHWTTSTIAAPAASVSGSFGLFQPLNAFDETGSFFAGLQMGYNYVLPNRFIVGVETDASFPSFLNPARISIGGTSALFAPSIGAEAFSETVLSSGTVRGRIGYAPGNWLLYATGGLAWTYDHITLTQLASGQTATPFLWRFGWTAGAGVEVPVAPHWTARLEYLFTDYGLSSVTFRGMGQRFNSDFALQELRAGLNYRFGSDASSAITITKASSTPDLENVNIHGQTTFVWQGYPAFRSAFAGTNSLPAGGQGRETWDATLYAGVRLWQGAELWIDPEIDQGFGLHNTLGVAGFTTGTAFKVGSDFPYARVQRYFVRQTIDLGGGTQKVAADLNQFAGSHTNDRLVVTVGKFSISDVFDTNKYAQNPRQDFMNWGLIDAGSFDYAADAWGFTYGASVEWYLGNWTLRGGWFDLSIVPNSTELDPTFQQFQWIGEIERRYDLWGHAGKIAVTGFLSRGRMGTFEDAIALAAITGGPAEMAPVRQYRSRPGLAFNLEQEITSDLGVFLRAGVADGYVEPYDYTDIDRTIAAGLSLTGKGWGRPDDTFGLAGIVNSISPAHVAFLNDGGLGILVGDRTLPHPGPEQIIESYYKLPFYGWNLTFDYQYIVNPAYNRDRGPVSVFGVRLHTQF